jgi:hypothetical protein
LLRSAYCRCGLPVLVAPTIGRWLIDILVPGLMAALITVNGCMRFACGAKDLVFPLEAGFARLDNFAAEHLP